MPTSIMGADVQAVLDKTRVPGFKGVQVGNQVVEIPSPFPSPEDWRDTTMYFLLVDRFNNPLAPPNNLPWDSEYSDFQGGTFNGIRDQLDYLKALGVGAIWLSPVQKNCQYSPSYHGYGIQDFLTIEPRFASNPAQAKQDPQFVENELRQLVDKAQPSSPGEVEEKAAGSVTVTEVDGSITQGPLHVVAVNMQPMEIQILGKSR